MWNFLETLVNVLAVLIFYILCLAVTVVVLVLMAILVGVVAVYEALTGRGRTLSQARKEKGCARSV